MSTYLGNGFPPRNGLCHHCNAVIQIGADVYWDVRSPDVHYCSEPCLRSAQDGTPAVQTLRQAAEKWMLEHPRAMSLFARFALDMLHARRRFGFRLLAERVRWECLIDPGQEDGFKLNDHYTPYIARRLVRDMPLLANLIETRTTHAANRPARSPTKRQRVDPLTEEPV